MARGVLTASRMRILAIGLILALAALAGCGTATGEDLAAPAVRSDAGSTSDARPGAAELDRVAANDDGPASGGDGAAPTPTPARCAPGLPGKAGETTVTVVSGGLGRTAVVHVPPTYDPTKETMLVLNFHGYGSDDVQQRGLTQMDLAADAHGFIVAYPTGVAASWNAGQCCGTAWTNAVDDVAFVKALLAQLESTWCIDPKRVHATGMSNGGFLSHRLACEMADTFASIAPVAGVLGIDPSACKPSRPIAVLDVHGTLDTVVPYAGGMPILAIDLGPVLGFRSVPDTIRFWQQRNGCTGAPTTVFQKDDATCTRYGACEAGVEVVHCAIEGGGHTWPGGAPVWWFGKTSTAMSATDMMVAFFKAHPMP